MRAIDTQGVLNDVMSDPARKIPKAHLNSVCKIHCGSETCRYIGLGIYGYVCVKNSRMQTALDNLCDEQKLTATGDNCEGLKTT